MRNNKSTATLLLHCADQKGIVVAVCDFVYQNDGNIINLDQHVDRENNHFFMRVEWDLEGFIIPKDKISDYFQTLMGSKFNITYELHFSDTVPRVALFVSRFSHCLLDLLARYESKELKVEIPLIISNHDKFRYIGERYDIPYYHFPLSKDNKSEVEDKQIRLLRKFDVDMIILARYMQILSENFCKMFENKIVNIHHSTLPAFAGANPYRAAYERGVKFMGATAHYVTPHLDAGPIINQGVIPIPHEDSVRDMKRKGRDIEKIVLANAVWDHINNKIITYQNRTVVFRT